MDLALLLFKVEAECQTRETEEELDGMKKGVEKGL